MLLEAFVNACIVVALPIVELVYTALLFDWQGCIVGSRKYAVLLGMLRQIMANGEQKVAAVQGAQYKRQGLGSSMLRHANAALEGMKGSAWFHYVHTATDTRC